MLTKTLNKIIDKQENTDMWPTINQPRMPENYYGMNFSVNNITIGDNLYLGNRNTVDLLTVLEISFHDEMYYFTVVDAKAHKFTIRYYINSRVNIKQK